MLLWPVNVKACSQSAVALCRLAAWSCRPAGGCSGCPHHHAYRPHAPAARSSPAVHLLLRLQLDKLHVHLSKLLLLLAKLLLLLGDLLLQAAV